MSVSARFWVTLHYYKTNDWNSMAKYKLKNLLKEFHAGKSIASGLIKDVGEYPVFGGNGQRGYTDTYNQGGQYLIIGRQGAYCGNVRYNIGKAFLTEHAIVGQANEENNAIYLALKLSLMDLGKLQGQSAQPGLSVETLSCISLDIPSKETQDAIAKIIVTLDKKIALNRQINDNLEAMAKQLYDYWFVQFDFPNEEGKPYKSSGGVMVWNEMLKREIPQGWNDCKIKDFMRIFTGKKDVSKAVPGNYKFFSCAPEPISSNEYIYDGYAVLVSGNGSYTGRVGFYKGKFDLYQRTYACVLDEDEHNISFFYYTLRYLFQPIYSGGKHGSSIPYIVLGDLADFRFAFNETICTKFVDAAKPMFDEQLLRQKEIESLTKQRDELLPLLMNGQATVNYHLYVYLQLLIYCIFPHVVKINSI